MATQRIALVLLLAACTNPTAPADIHSVLLTNAFPEAYSGVVMSKPTEAFRVEFTVQPGYRSCLTFQTSQLRGDSIIVIASYFVSDISHPVGDTLTARSGLNWTWDGSTASLSAAC